MAAIHRNTQVGPTQTKRIHFLVQFLKQSPGLHLIAIYADAFEEDGLTKEGGLCAMVAAATAQTDRNDMY